MGMTIKKKIMADTDNKELEERCERCEHFHILKHNFEAGTGFEESACCDVLLHLPGSTDDIKAWVQEVSRLNICEMFTAVKQDEKAKPQEQEPTIKIDYRRAFKIACELLNGDVLYGVDTDKIYELMMKKDGVISSSSYEEYILNHLQELDQGQYASEPTTKNDLGVDAVSRQAVLELMADNDLSMGQVVRGIHALPSVTPQLSSGTRKNSKKLEIDKSDDFEEWKLNEDKDRYIRIGDILERFKEVDEYFGHDPWTLKQIFSNLNILPSSVFQRFTDKDDCISRQAVLEQAYAYGNGLEPDGYCVNVEDIKALPSVTPQEPRKGHWIFHSGAVYDEYICSNCNKRHADYATNYCPNCGADMREVVKE